MWKLGDWSAVMVHEASASLLGRLMYDSFTTVPSAFKVILYECGFQVVD